MTTLGWDIGGVNTKVARVAEGVVYEVVERPYEVQRAPDRLSDVLRALAAEAGAEGGATFSCAVTMTAELSQMFRTKREGVAFVLDAVERAFPDSAINVFGVHGRFVTPAAARRAPLEVAAANWAAAARMVAAHHADALLVDIGTTTTDIIPIAGGRVAAHGRTDPERLASGELVYTGAVRTPAEAIASVVPFAGRAARVSAEGFALSGDVHVWRGNLGPHDYTWPTPDGRPATRAFAAERLARVVCADREIIDDAGISAIADALAAAQSARISEAMRQVLGRHPGIRTAVVTGAGAFLAASTARAAGLEVISLAASLGAAAARCAPAVAVALLLAQARGESAGSSGPDPDDASSASGLVDVVVKLGGGVLTDVERFAAAVSAIGRLARGRRLLVVPGGGPFADAVRDVDGRLGLDDEAAHWMAVLGMDQYAHLLASRLAGGAIADSRTDIRATLASGRIPVLAPSRWLRDADPLPHTWDATSDSIAAWVAGQVGARELVLVKPGGAAGDVVDACFRTALPHSVAASIVTADRIEEWTDRVLSGSSRTAAR